MKITVIQGHLTQTEKTAIKLMFDRGLTSAKINRKNYFLTAEDGFYKVAIVQKERSFIGSDLKDVFYFHTIKVEKSLTE